jgi:hypothetical protein
VSTISQDSTVSTLRVVAYSLLSIFLTGTFIQLGGVLMGTVSRGGQELGANALAIPAFWVFLGFLVFSALLMALARYEFLNRAELLCVLFAGLLAAPIMTVGFWRYLVPAAATFPRGEDFELLDAVNPNLWPHGRNLTDGILAEPAAPGVDTQGSVRWETRSLSKGGTERVPVIEHLAGTATSNLRVRLPVGPGLENAVIPGQPYLLSVLARADGLGVDAYYYCRLYHGTGGHFLQEAFTSTKEAELTFSQPEGFRRVGAYGVVVPGKVKDSVVLELGLNGTGRVAFRDLQFMNVDAVESAFRGRVVVPERDLAQVPEEERPGILVEPDRLLSVAGIRYLLSAYIPWKDWLRPLWTWGAYIALVLTGTFSIAVIMRREWIDNQRLPLPFAQIPLFFLGRNNRDEAPRRFFPDGWRSGFMWAGFTATVFWCVLRALHDFHGGMPDLNINVRLNAYISNPYLERMFRGVHFQVLALFLGLALFLELNVLMSLIIGFLLFRAQYLVGEFYGLTYQAGFPETSHQRLAAYLVYAALLVFFSRRYLFRLLLAAIRGEDRGDEVLSSRSAVLLLIISIAGVGIWARAVGMPIGPMLLIFLTLLSVGFVAMKLRAECGVPSYAFFPHLVLIVGFAGGMSVFGTQGTMFAVFVSAIIGYHAFFLIPGLQLEFLELGRHFRLKRRVIFIVNGVAIIGGFLIGGWIFLSGAYAKGIDSFPDSGDYRGIIGWGRYYALYHTEATMATTAQMEEEAHRNVSPRTWAILYSGTLTFVVTVLRQTVTGFWFHPAGIIIGSMGALYRVWGSLLIAWAIRFTVLKMGGAATVREKLLPFAAGIFLGSVTAQGLFFAIDCFLFYFTDSSQLQFGLF